MITIFIPSPLRRFADEKTKVELQANTVAEAVHALTVAYPPLKPYLYDEEDALRQHVRLYLGDDDVRDRDGIHTLLKEGDELSIIPAIAGGTGHPECVRARCSTPGQNLLGEIQ